MPEKDFPNARFYQQDIEFASRFINPTYIGQFLGQGMRTRVYALSPQFSLSDIYASVLDPRVGVLESQRESELRVNKFVVKIPKKESCLPPSTAAKKLSDFQKGIEFLGDIVMLPTFILSERQTTDYCVLQNDLGRFENLSPSNVSEVLPQLGVVFDAYRALLRKGLYLELLGRDGTVSCIRAILDHQTQPQMTNLVVQRSNEGSGVKIHDVSLFGFTREYNTTALDCAKNLIRFAAFHLDQRLIKYHFGVNPG